MTVDKGELTVRVLKVIFSGLIALGILAGWFYLVDKNIMKPEGLEMFLTAGGMGFLAYFFHTSQKKENQP